MRTIQPDTFLQQAGLNVGYLVDERDQEAVRQEGGPPGHQHGDRQRAILKDVYQGAGQPAKNPIPPTIWSY